MKYMSPINLLQDLLKSSASQRGRLLGLDAGDRYVGLYHNQVASPLRSPNFPSQASYSATHFIDIEADAVQVKLLVEDLCRSEHLEGLKYTFWDECFTSKHVEMLLKDLNLHPVQSKSIIDKFAAVGILQGYLDFATKQMKKVSVDEDFF